ncbi:MAG: hypothetical protein ACFFDN_40140 [Candidatus Hodarchaeota archaeon]
MMNDRLLRISGIFASLFGLILILFGNIKTTTNFRILSDIIQNILLFNILLLLILPEQKRLENSLILGLFTMIFDFFLETIAVYFNWWYPRGGFQAPPILIIPLEMVISFMLIGTTVGIILGAPEKIRNMELKPFNWLKFFVKNPRFDLMWRILFIFVNALVGTNGDYTAGYEIWVPGPYWHWIYTFFVWFGGGMIILLVFYYLEKRRE